MSQVPLHLTLANDAYMIQHEGFVLSFKLNPSDAADAEFDEDLRTDIGRSILHFVQDVWTGTAALHVWKHGDVDPETCVEGKVNVLVPHKIKDADGDPLDPGSPVIGMIAAKDFAAGAIRLMKSGPDAE